ncbi:hypothetical protein GGF46_002048 [Coemansia sp. RSA 552]|nr:hypothetical protein GGF46_002048 [Coemansia sp. RSA 552]
MKHLDMPLQHTTGVVKTWSTGAWSYKIYDAEYARRLFTKTGIFQKVEVKKRFPYGPGINADSFIFENGEDYHSHRAIISPIFRRSWPAHLFKKPLDQLMDAIELGSAQKMDIGHWLRRGTLDVLGHIVMGYDFGALADPDSEACNLYDLMMEALVNPLYMAFPWLDRYPVGKRVVQKRNANDYNMFLERIIDTRLDEMKNHPALSEEDRNHADLLTLLLEAYNQSKSGNVFDDRGKQVAPMSREQLRSNIALFYIAGHDTTANSLAYVMMELARFPDIQTKARNIVIGVLGDRKDAYPTDEQLKELGYIDLIVKEALRKNSIIPEIRRYLAETVQLGSYTLPKGSSVSVDVWSMHYNPEYFPAPERFAPERFSKDGPPELKRNVPFTYAPFGGGARQCIGMRFSFVEQRIAIALLLLRFEWALPSDSPFWHSTPAKSMGLISPVGLKVDIKPRFS